MIEPTDEMVQEVYSRIDFVNHGDDGIADGLAAVLAIVERDYDVLIRQGERCFCGADLGPPWDTTPHRIGTPGCQSAS